MSDFATRGQPSVLDESVDSFAAIREALERVAQQIEASLEDFEAQAIDAVEEKARGAASLLRSAAVRYERSGAALATYSAVLKDFNAQADALRQEHAERQAAVATAQVSVDHATGQVRAAALRPDEPWIFNYWHAELGEAQSVLARARSEAGLVVARYNAALDVLEKAAWEAAAIVNECFDQAKSAAQAWLEQTLGVAKALVEATAHWARDVLAAVLEEVLRVLIYVGLAVAIVLVVAVVAGVGIVALAAAIIVGLAVLLAALIFSLGVLIRHLALEMADEVLDRLHVDAQDRLAIVMFLVGVVSPQLGLRIRERILSEAMRPTPPVTRLDRSALDDAARDRVAELAKAPDDLADLLAWAGDIDAAGKDKQTVIDIAKVTGEDGTVSWIVTVPSTQDWVIGKDKPALNDLDVDLALMLMPELQGAYERAVLAAMAQAGIGPSDPVMMVGWSLGGILSGKMAAQGAGGYNYQGVLAAGAPIDHFDIDAPTLQVKNSNDIVHRLDMVERGDQDATHKELWDGALGGTVGATYAFDNLIGHSNEAYVATLSAHLEADTANNLEAMFSQVIDFGADAEGQTITHQQFAVHE